MKLSAVIPLYKCESFINELTYRLIASLEQISDLFEIILVNDNSPVQDWKIVLELCRTDKRIKGINLSRNFGQHCAITAGIEHASGDWIFILDGDLQDPPEETVKLFNYALNNNFDVVWGRRKIRKHNFFKRASSRVFYLLFDYLSGYESDPLIANFSVIKRKVALGYLSMKEQNRAYPLFIRWMGFNVGYIDIDHKSRMIGSSSYNIRKLFRLAFDSIVAYSNKPLRLGLYFGVLVAFISVLLVLYYLARYFIHGITVEGWTTVVVSMWFMFGVTMSFLGLLGLYIGKIFDENKNRPIYIISEMVNFDLNT